MKVKGPAGRIRAKVWATHLWYCLNDHKARSEILKRHQYARVCPRVFKELPDKAVAELIGLNDETFRGYVNGEHAPDFSVMVETSNKVVTIGQREFTPFIDTLYGPGGLFAALDATTHRECVGLIYGLPEDDGQYPVRPLDYEFGLRYEKQLGNASGLEGGLQKILEGALDSDGRISHLAFEEAFALSVACARLLDNYNYLASLIQAACSYYHRYFDVAPHEFATLVPQAKRFREYLGQSTFEDWDENGTVRLKIGAGRGETRLDTDTENQGFVTIPTPD